MVKLVVQPQVDTVLTVDQAVQHPFGRRIVAGSGLVFLDGGPGSTLTIFADAAFIETFAGRPGLDGQDGEDGLSIIGPKGDTGQDGVSIAGQDGEDGIDGYGIPGVNGLNGINGVNGQDGIMFNPFTKIPLSCSRGLRFQLLISRRTAIFAK